MTRRAGGTAADLRAILKDEDGGVSAFSIFFLMGTLIVGGLAVDYANALKLETRLQLTADAAAHAALVVADTGEIEEGRQRGLQLVRANMPASYNGVVSAADDIRFGRWDPESRIFTYDETSGDAVEVWTHRNVRHNNRIATYLLQFAGFDGWDLSRKALFAVDRQDGYSGCLNEGFIAEGMVDLQSNNTYGAGFCVYSSSTISLNNHNEFAFGAIVATPDNSESLDLTGAGFSMNPGLADALMEFRLNLDVEEQTARIINELWAGTYEDLPGYIYDPEPITIPASTLDETSFLEGRVHEMFCGGAGGSVKIKQNTVLRNFVLLTDCDLDFGNIVTLENVIIATTSTDDRSVKASSGLTVGRWDSCAEGGGANILTMGGMHFASNLSMSGGQLIAAGDVDFAAQGNGLTGTSIIAGGNIDGTSNTNVGLCGTGHDQIISWPVGQLKVTLAG